MNKGRVVKLVVLGVVLLWLCSDYRWNPSAAYKSRCKFLIGTWRHAALDAELEFKDNNQFTYRGNIRGTQYPFRGEGDTILFDFSADTDKTITFSDYVHELNGAAFTGKGTYQIFSKPLFIGAHSVFEVLITWNEIDKYRVANEYPSQSTASIMLVFPKENLLDFDFEGGNIYIKDSDQPDKPKTKKKSPEAPSS